MPIIPKDPTPEFGSNEFNSTQGITIANAFYKYFTRVPAGTLDKGEVEQIFNNEEADLS